MQCLALAQTAFKLPTLSVSRDCNDVEIKTLRRVFPRDERYFAQESVRAGVMAFCLEYLEAIVVQGAAGKFIPLVSCLKCGDIGRS